MKTRVLTARDVQSLIRAVGLDRLVDDLIATTAEAFSAFDEATHHIPVRSGFSYLEPVVGLVEFMPVHVFGRAVTQKAVAYHPRNPVDHGLPTILSSVSVYDVRTGHLDALLDGVLLTALRTGVASALATRAFAHQEAETLGMIGCGAQGVAQVHALSRIRPLKRVLAHDPDRAVQDSYRRRLAAIGLELPVEFASPDVLLAEADVLVTATSVEVGVGQVFADGPHHDHLHINAVGSDFPGKTECPLALLRRAEVIPDFREQALLEGESQRLDPAGLGPELLTALHDGVERTHRLTVFDSTGWAFEDHVTAAFLLERARAHDVGQDLELESIPADPYNPFA